MICFSVIVIGRVQGVFYRSSTKNKADQLGIMGWVRNESDGSVRMELEGMEERVAEMIEWCRQGPLYARVENLVMEQLDLKDYKDFEVRY